MLITTSLVSCDSSTPTSISESPQGPPRLCWMVKLLSSGTLLASLCRAAVASSQCSVTASSRQSCPALLLVRMVHVKCRGETYKYGNEEVKSRRFIYDAIKSESDILG